MRLAAGLAGPRTVAATSSGVTSAASTGVPVSSVFSVAACCRILPAMAV